MSLVRCALVVVLLAATSVLAQQSRPVDKRAVTIEGTVEQGPCARALTLRASNGERFEVDPSRIHLTIGNRGTYSGTVYPRISICNKCPWLDIAPSREARTLTAAAKQTLPRADEQETTVVLVTSQAQLSARMREAKELRSQLPAQVKVVVGLRSADAQDPQAQWKSLASTLIALRDAQPDPQLFTGISIHVIAPSTPDGVIQQSPTGERRFPSVEAFVGEWHRDPRRPS